jgi:hypothetical protein
MAQTAQTIQGFYQQATNYNFSRDFNFRIIEITSDGNAAYTMSDGGLLVYAKTASLPAREITNVPVPYMGLNFNLPGNAIYPDGTGYSITFYADQASGIRQLFEDWSRWVFDDQSSTGQYNTPSKNATITLAQLDNQNNAIATYVLYGVTPRNVGPLNYTMAAGTGQTVEFTVTLAYHYFVRTTPLGGENAGSLIGVQVTTPPSQGHL